MEKLDLDYILQVLEPIDRYGGISHILSLYDSGTVGDHYEWYAKIQKDRSIQRSAIDFFGNKHSKCLTLSSAEVNEFLEKSVQQLQEIKNKTIRRNNVKACDIEITLPSIEIDSISTGYPKLDALIGGLGRGNLIILAARPAVGKTAFACNLALAAVHNQKKVMFFSCEMSNVQISRRMVSCFSQAVITKMDSSHLAKSIEKFHSFQITFNEIDKKIHEICEIIRDEYYQNGLDLVIIDYLQLIESYGQVENRNLEVAQYTRRLKSIAHEIKVPVLCLSQLNRAIELRTDQTPKLSDLRDSGSIEQDADVVMFLSESQYKTNLNVAKNRHGYTGQLAFTFKQEISRFEE